MPRLERKTTCCPDKPHYAKGLCRTCYLRNKHKRKYRNDPHYRSRLLEKSRRHYAKHTEQKKEYQRQWSASNKEHIRRYQLEKAYGITLEDYQRLFEKQAGLCAICQELPAKCVDHDHETGQIRGLLCSKCNLDLGTYEQLKKNRLISKMEEYLSFYF